MTPCHETRPADAHRRLAATALSLGSDVVWLSWAVCLFVLCALVVTIVGGTVSKIF